MDLQIWIIHDYLESNICLFTLFPNILNISICFLGLFLCFCIFSIFTMIFAIIYLQWLYFCFSFSWSNISFLHPFIYLSRRTKLSKISYRLTPWYSAQCCSTHRIDINSDHFASNFYLFIVFSIQNFSSKTNW